MFVGIDLLKIDSFNNEMNVRNMIGSLEELASDGDDRDKYWE